MAQNVEDAPLESETQVPSILHVPLDVVRLVGDHLPAESVAALALTYSAMYRTFGSDSMRLDFNSRRKFLDLLERKCRLTHFHCVPCGRFHRYSPQWTAFSPLSITNTSPTCLGVRENTFNPNSFNSPSYLSPTFIRLLMNRHRYGAPAGLPLDMIPKTMWIPTVDDTLAWRQNYSAAIIDDELFIQVEHIIEGQGETLRRSINDGYYWICNHVATFPYFDFSRGRRCQHPDIDWYLGDGKAECFEGEVRSCPVCPSDMSATLEKANVRHKRVVETFPTRLVHGPMVDGYRLRITSWHFLGKGLDPTSVEWQILTRHLWDLEEILNIERGFETLPVGDVQERWNSHHGESRQLTTDPSDE